MHQPVDSEPTWEELRETDLGIEGWYDPSLRAKLFRIEYEGGEFMSTYSPRAEWVSPRDYWRRLADGLHGALRVQGYRLSERAVRTFEWFAQQ